MLGWRRFEEETGIRYYDWYGQFWTRWNDAVREAGLEPNRMSEAYDDAFLVQKLVLLTRRLGRVPIQGIYCLRQRTIPHFLPKKPSGVLVQSSNVQPCSSPFVKLTPAMTMWPAFGGKFQSRSRQRMRMRPTPRIALSAMSIS